MLNILQVAKVLKTFFFTDTEFNQARPQLLGKLFQPGLVRPNPTKVEHSTVIPL